MGSAETFHYRRLAFRLSSHSTSRPVVAGVCEATRPGERHRYGL